MKELNEALIRKGWKSFLNYRERRLSGIQTGIGSIDRALLGLGGMVCIQGETSVGKSYFALQIIHHNLLQGNPAIILDHENGEGRLRSRLMCQASRVSDIELKICSEDDLKTYIRPVMDLPLYLYSEAIKDGEVLRQRVRECIELHQKPTILLVDSLQAITPMDADQRISLEKWMVFLDSLKLEFDGKLTVIVTSEKNRASYGQTAIGGAKGSNQVEYKSETLLDLSQSENGNTVVRVLKNRDGNRGMALELEKVYADPLNPNSFTFLLQEVGGPIDI